jgi:hypothetical protein
MISAVFAAALLLAQAAPAAGADAPKPVAAAAKAPKVNKDGLVCHTEEILGSRIPQRICFTPEEAAQRQQQDRQNIEHMQSFNYRSPG